MKFVVLASGGLDSTVLMAHLLAEGHEVHALGIDYGQRHRRELEALPLIAGTLRVQASRVNCDVLGTFSLLSGCALNDRSAAVPLGHYEDASMAATVVPNRNMVLLGLAGSLAQARGWGGVAYAAHAGDHTVYPDCRAGFVAPMCEAFDALGLDLRAPFLGMKKHQIVSRGAELQAPMRLTWSCYEGGEKHCGRCGTCVERIEAFKLAGVPDPTEYA